MIHISYSNSISYHTATSFPVKGALNNFINTTIATKIHKTFAMEPFTFLPAYNIIICCGQGRVTDEAAKHLQQKHRFSQQQQEEIIRNIYNIPGIIYTQVELK